jgi:hypothetical protein
VPAGAASVALPAPHAGVYIVKLTAGSVVTKRLWVKNMR